MLLIDGLLKYYFGTGGYPHNEKKKCPWGSKSTWTMRMARWNWGICKNWAVWQFMSLYMQCFSSVSYSMLINGLKYEKTVHIRGLRKGGPYHNICLIFTEVFSGY